MSGFKSSYWNDHKDEQPSTKEVYFVYYKKLHIHSNNQWEHKSAQSNSRFIIIIIRFIISYNKKSIHFYKNKHDPGNSHETWTCLWLYIFTGWKWLLYNQRQWFDRTSQQHYRSGGESPGSGFSVLKEILSRRIVLNESEESDCCSWNNQTSDVSLVGSHPYHWHSILQQIKVGSAVSVYTLNASFMLARTLTSSQRESSFLFKNGSALLASVIEDCSWSSQIKCLPVIWNKYILPLRLEMIVNVCSWDVKGCSHIINTGPNCEVTLQSNI